MVVGETLLSFTINDPGERFLEVQDWVRLTACSIQFRKMRCSADPEALAAPAAEQLGFRLLTQRQNSRGVTLQIRVPGGALEKARANSCHYTTHHAWSVHLPEFKLNKKGQVVRKLPLSTERQRSVGNLSVAATHDREDSRSDDTAGRQKAPANTGVPPCVCSQKSWSARKGMHHSGASFSGRQARTAGGSGHNMGRAGDSEPHHSPCDYGSSSSSSHPTAAQCRRHPPTTFFGMNGHLVCPSMPCTCSLKSSRAEE